MKKFALLACSLLFVSSSAFAAVNAEIAQAARNAAATNAPGFTVAGVAYTVAVAAGVITITQGNGTGSTVIGTVGTK